ncbi:hypothetical protein [Ideonella sp.]|uniref:hypothetical protein n=1 Tax=Ideonella sp. TaxID=1929293 RepID=UPI003BB7D6C7
MDNNNSRTSPAPASSSLLRRWLAPRAVPVNVPDSAEMDLGYESALPWFAESELPAGATGSNGR